MGERIVVGMADMRVGFGTDQLVTFALGSCLGVSVCDPVTKVGALLHVMMPSAKISPDKAKANPYMFVDTGIPMLFKQLQEKGAKRDRMLVCVAGGASPASATRKDSFQTGRRNMLMLKKLFWKNAILIKAEDVGGVDPRTMDLDIESREVGITFESNRKVLLSW